MGTGPFALVTGDFNRDGIPDLAVANADADSISILLGRGDGRASVNTFTTQSVLSPRGLAVADWNNDGRLDLIATGYANKSVAVLLGTGHGRFVPGPIHVGAASQPQGVAAADFNHDGRLDLAVAYASTGGLQILYGTATGFTARTVAGDTYLNVLASGDFNTDGWMDVAAASTSRGTVTVYRGSATGLARLRTYVTGSSPRGIAAVDVTHDGVLDLITANRGGNTVSVLRGDVTRPGSFLPQTEVAAGAGSRDVAAADFNGDGRFDLATANEYASTATVLSNETVFAPAAYAFRHMEIGSSDGAISIAQDAWPADFNRDGKVDLAVIGANDRAVTILLTGGPTVLLPVSGRIRRFMTGDFNADGHADVLYAAALDGVTIGLYFGNGRGSFTAAEETDLPWAYGTLTLAAGDLNRDAITDLVYIDRDTRVNNYTLSVMLGAADGTFQPGPATLLPAPPEDSRSGRHQPGWSARCRADALRVRPGRIRERGCLARESFRSARRPVRVSDAPGRIRRRCRPGRRQPRRLR